MSEVFETPEKVSLRSRLYSSAALARDPDETEGRKLYRAFADYEARLSVWYGKRGVVKMKAKP